MTTALQVASSAQSTTHAIYEQNKASVVLLLAYDALGMPSALGSGFYFETNRIASNYHVIEGASRVLVRVIGSKETHEAKRIACASKVLDLAILEVEEGQPPARIAPIDNVGIGDKVVAIGNPRGLEGSVSEGIVSAIRTSKEAKYLQITTPISPGSSGGPLFSEAGEVIGITTATLRDSQNLNFAIPATLLLTLRDKGRNWEPAVSKDKPAIHTGNAGVELVAPNFENIFRSPPKFWFSLISTNNRAIQNVSFLLVFRDKKTARVLNYIARTTARLQPDTGGHLLATDESAGYNPPIGEILPPGLAKRFFVEDKSLQGYWIGNPGGGHDLGDGYWMADVRVELRVLTYDFVGDGVSHDLDALQR